MKRILLAVLLLLGVAATVSTSSAASLSLLGGSSGMFGAAHPCPAAVAVTPVTSGSTFSSVTVALAPACADRTLRVAVRTGTTTLEATSTATGSPRTVTFAGSADAGSVVSVAATIGGWNLPARWSYTPPAQPFVAGNAQTVIQSIVWSTSGAETCALITVSTTTAQSSPWRVALNIAAAPFNGATTGYVIRTGQVRFDPSATPVNGVIGIVGSVNGWDTLSAGQARSFTVCR